MALKGPTNINGKVEVSADDGTGAKEKPKGPVKYPVDESVEQGPAKASGHVGDWFFITGKANAEKNATAPAAAVAKASSKNSATSDFELTAEDKKFALHAEMEIQASLTETGTATIKLGAKVTPAAGGTPRTLDKTYSLKIDPADATGKTIKIDGGQPNTMKNGGKVTQKEPPGAPTVVTMAKANYNLEFSVTIESSGLKEDVSVLSAKLELH